MKNLLFLSATFLLIVGCDSPKAKVYSCTAYSSECELQKDQILLIPITYDSTTIDAYGHSINNKRINQWYAISTKVKVLVPVGVPVLVRDGAGLNASSTLEYYPSPALLTYKWRPNIRVDTLDVSTLIPGLTSAAVVISGPNEIAANYGKAELAHTTVLAKN